MKAIPELADLESNDLTQHVRAWHDKLPPIADHCFEDTEDEIVKAWETAKYAAGDGPVEQALANAFKSGPPACAAQFDGEQIKMLVSLCCELQRLSGNKPFFLACRTASRLLGASHTKMAKRLRILVRKEILEIVELGGPTTNKATRYFYLPSYDIDTIDF